MKRSGSVRRILSAVALALALPVASWADSGAGTGDKGTDMLIDLVLLRPMGLAATGVGSVVFLVSLPFSLASGGAGSAACELVGEPLAYTFTRPLGEIEGSASYCGRERVGTGDSPAP